MMETEGLSVDNIRFEVEQPNIKTTKIKNGIF